MDKVLGFGIIGSGGISSAHANAIKSVPGTKLVACSDIIPERAQRLAEKFGCEWYGDNKKLVERDDIDVVNVCTPSGLHAEHGLLAAQAGKHVIVEKPMDLSLKKIDRLIETCGKKKLKLTCIFQYRFSKSGRLIKQAVDEGRFGQLVFATAECKWFRAQSYYDSGDWRGTWRYDGGVLSNQGIHYIDQLCWLAGDFERVEYAKVETRARKMEAEDSAVAVVMFKSGAWGVIQGSTLAYPGLAGRIEICGTVGSAVHNGDTLMHWKVEGEEEAPDIEAQASSVASADPAIAALKGHDAQVADFVLAIREGRDPYIKPEDARQSVALLRAIYEKALGRQPLPD